MTLCLDACVLYPTVLREILMGVIRAHEFQPVWSPRILEEWQRAADRRGGGDGEIAAGEIAHLRAAWPQAAIDGASEEGLWLPDPADIHVLATARAAGAKKIITLNLRDFPRRELQGYGIEAEHPDAFLYALWLADGARVAEVVRSVHARAEKLAGTELPPRALLKRARLPRLGKALAD